MNSIESVMQISPHFKIQELVPRSIFEKYGVESTQFISKNIVSALESLRLHFSKPIYVNDWVSGGKLEYRGFREANCKVGALNSAHKRGMAADINIDGYSSDEVINYLKKNYSKHGITMIEDDTPTWVHISVVWFKPKQLAIYDKMLDMMYFQE